MLTERFERLNALAQLNSAGRYLEIGVSKGTTFKQVNVHYKVAVDPVFQFNTADYANDHTIFHKVTSDAFFSKLAPAHGQFDLIYIDGLHTFEQTFRDFCASLGHCHARTIWLLDDTCPTSFLAAIRSRRVSLRTRKIIGIRDRKWMGDVFKVVLAIHDFFPEFSYATFPGHGQTVVWRQTRDDFAPTWDSLARITRMRYRDFSRFRDSHLKIMEVPAILDAVRKAVAA
jgi:hypothetical protein